MCASLHSLLVPDGARLISTERQEIELLIPPALNDLIAANRVEFVNE
jgi:hypothetical protein